MPDDLQSLASGAGPETPDLATPPPRGVSAGQPAREPTREELKAKSDAAILAAIDKFDTDHDDEGDMHVAVAGEPKPKADEEDEDDGQEELPGEDDDLEEAAEGDEGEQAELEGEDDGDDEEDQLHRAWNALREQDVPASVLKNMPKAKLIAWGMKVIEKGKATKDAGSGSAQPDATDRGAAKKDGPGKPAQAARADWSQATKAFAEELGVDEEAASKALKPLLEHIDLLSERFEASTQAALTRRGEVEIEAQMQRLSKKYPELKDEERHEAVLEEARTLAAGLRAQGKEIDPVSLFDRAALLVNGKPKRSDMKQLRRNGTSTPPTTRPSRTEDAAPNSTEYFARVLDEVDAGRPENARRIKPPSRSNASRW